MPSINPYITFHGNCEEAFDYYRSVFGGEFSSKNSFSEMPPSEDYELADEDKDKIMHVSLPLGDSVLMGSDVGGEWSSRINKGNNISISVNADSKEKADEYFDKLSKGGSVTMPMDNTFWGSYFGMCTDKFGISWMISVEGTSK